MTVTTYVLSDPDNIVLLPVVLLSYLLIRIFSAKSTLTIAKFVKWIAVFAVYMIIRFIITNKAIKVDQPGFPF